MRKSNPAVRVVAKIAVTGAVLVGGPQKVLLTEVTSVHGVRFDGNSHGGTIEGVGQML